jgi:hypothetical protein
MEIVCHLSLAQAYVHMWGSASYSPVVPIRKYAHTLPAQAAFMRPCLHILQAQINSLILS